MRMYKQKLDVIPEQIVKLPVYKSEKEDIVIKQLTVQNNSPCIWFLTNCSKMMVVKFYCFMTGEDIPDYIKSNEYIGSCMLDDIVIHVFMKRIEERASGG